MPKPQIEGVVYSEYKSSASVLKLLSYLRDESAHPVDLLAKKAPAVDYDYFDRHGMLKKSRVAAIPARREKGPHPALKRHYDNHTANKSLEAYYADLPPDQIRPIAGKTLDSHYGSNRGQPMWMMDGVLTSQDPYTKKQTLQEDSFHGRPSVKLTIPDQIKAILVDDWENVTKNQQLVPLPSSHSVNSILDDYLNEEKSKREPGSAEADILEEVVAGLREYFDKCLGRILLYRLVNWFKITSNKLETDASLGLSVINTWRCWSYGARRAAI
jgi:mortality factor 4-like protein 1